MHKSDTAEMLTVVNSGRPNPARGWIFNRVPLAAPPLPGTPVNIVFGYHGCTPMPGVVVESPHVNSRHHGPGTRYRELHSTFRVSTLATETRRITDRHGNVTEWAQPVHTFDVEFISESFNPATVYDKQAAADALPEWAKADYRVAF